MKSLHGPLPRSFAATRDSLHRVAEQIVAPARKPPNEIALRQTPGGFGTPEFEFHGAATQVRVAGAELVVARDGDERRAELTTLADAGSLVGEDLLPDGVPGEQAALEINREAAERLGEFYGFAASVLDEFRSTLGAEDEVSDLNLWPEHFDIAFEGGSEEAGQRANYGASPGDEAHPEPYLYVGPWSGDVEGELWNGIGFGGAELTYAELLDAGDQGAAALEFFQSRRRALAEA
jgi:hypothetical protein